MDIPCVTLLSCLSSKPLRRSHPDVKPLADAMSFVFPLSSCSQTCKSGAAIFSTSRASLLQSLPYLRAGRALDANQVCWPLPTCRVVAVQVPRHPPRPESRARVRAKGRAGPCGRVRALPRYRAAAAPRRSMYRASPNLQHLSRDPIPPFERPVTYEIGLALITARYAYLVRDGRPRPGTIHRRG